MKKYLTIIAVVTIILITFLNINKVYAANSSNEVLNDQAKSTLVQLKEKELESMQDYEEAYGSKTYGFTAYILHKVQVYSIPFCFLGILVGAICQYVTGIRHIETKEKGLALMVTFVTIAVICQVLPLVFTIVVKFGRE